MSNNPAPEKLYWVQTGSYDLASYIPGDGRYKTTEYIRRDLHQGERERFLRLLKFCDCADCDYSDEERLALIDEFLEQEAKSGN